MNSHDLHALLLIVVCGAVTLLLRALPFLTFGRRTPPVILYLGRVLPYAIMGMLVVYCLRGVAPLEAPHGAPEFIACAAVALLHLWRRNTLLSIVGGTACYMLLVQLVF
ncbi:MAG: branched-chain amino acid transporter permease [Fretibacterium sp.]|nr:branched-chain amino acid transporter permease [Fretibacterium sp.]